MEEWKGGGEGGRGEEGVGDVARAVPLASGATPVALTAHSAELSIIDTRVMDIIISPRSAFLIAFVPR